MKSFEVTTADPQLSAEEIVSIAQIYQDMHNHITTTGGYTLENDRDIRLGYTLLSRLNGRGFKQLTSAQLTFVREIL